MGCDDLNNARRPTPACDDGWRAWLALNASTGALLAAILLVGMGSELWSPLMPEYLTAARPDPPHRPVTARAKDLLDAIAFYLGGVLAARFNTRRALLLFNALPLVGLAILLVWPNKYAVFVALPFVGIWNSIAGPATLRVVGDSLSTPAPLDGLFAAVDPEAAVVAAGLFRQRPAGAGYSVSCRACALALAVRLVLVTLSLLLQYRYMRTAVVDQVARRCSSPWNCCGNSIRSCAAAGRATSWRAGATDMAREFHDSVLRVDPVSRRTAGRRPRRRRSTSASCCP